MTPRECAFAGAAFLSTDAQQLLTLDGAPETLREALRRDAPELEREYVRLFLSPAGALCPLWQSAHEAERSLMGEAHRSASRWYSLYGAAPATDADPADHVGLLLTFYAQMLASGACDPELEAFSTRHLRWITGFAESVAASAKLSFYRELGTWVAGLVQEYLSTRTTATTQNEPGGASGSVEGGLQRQRPGARHKVQ